MDKNGKHLLRPVPEHRGGARAECVGTRRLVMPEPPKDEADEDPLSKMLRERAERRKA